MSTKEEVLKLLNSNKGSFISGQEIAGALNVSRAAVWKAIKSLESDGLMIEVHNDPIHALCDGAQSLTPAQFDDVAKKVFEIREVIK